MISLLVQAGDERVTLVTYRFKYLRTIAVSEHAFT